MLDDFEVIHNAIDITIKYDFCNLLKLPIKTQNLFNKLEIFHYQVKQENHFGKQIMT